MMFMPFTSVKGFFVRRIYNVSATNNQNRKTHSLSPCRMKSPQRHIQGDIDYESVQTSYSKRT